MKILLVRASDGLIEDEVHLTIKSNKLEGFFPNGLHIKHHDHVELGHVVAPWVWIEGRADMRPDSSITIVGVDEAAFVGGHMMTPQPSDPGVWVTGHGILDVRGTPKRAWTNVIGSLHKGQTRFEVEDASGWKVGDRISITPTTPPTPDNGEFHQDINHTLTYDERTILSIEGNTIEVFPLGFDHPSCPYTDWNGNEGEFTAEVLNLSRDIVIQGTPAGRSHIQFLHTHHPQHLSHVEIRYMGPRQTVAGGKTQAVLGRYGLHFHHCGDGSRGSLVEGVVAHSLGGSAFVPHDSHGIEFRDCVAHDVQSAAYWWDQPERGDLEVPSHDIHWIGCVASRVWAADNAVEGYRLAGFVLLNGNDESNRLIDCVAVGVRNGTRATMNTSTVSGIMWAERPRARWVSKNILAHNNGGSGIFDWQNTEDVHLLEEIYTYRNGRYGVEHGAYQNSWLYDKGVCVEDRVAGIGIHAITRRTNATRDPKPYLTFRDYVIEGHGLTRYGILTPSHRFPADDPDEITKIIRARVSGCDYSYYEGPTDHATRIDFIDCTFEEPQFYFDPNAPLDTVLRIYPDGFLLLHPSKPGERVDRWNATRVWENHG